VAKQLSVADLSARSAKAANVASAISSGGDIASTAITLISNIQDQKKRAQFQNNFSLLSADQQKALDKQLINANSESERLRILGERLTQLNIQRISNIAGVFAEQEKKKRNQQLLIGGGILLLLASAVFIIVKKT
jgi:hypothetical protein